MLRHDTDIRLEHLYIRENLMIDALQHIGCLPFVVDHFQGIIDVAIAERLCVHHRSLQLKLAQDGQ